MTLPQLCWCPELAVTEWSLPSNTWQHICICIDAILRSSACLQIQMRSQDVIVSFYSRCKRSYSCSHHMIARPTCIHPCGISRPKSCDCMAVYSPNLMSLRLPIGLPYGDAQSTVMLKQWLKAHLGSTPACMALALCEAGCMPQCIIKAQRSIACLAEIGARHMRRSSVRFCSVVTYS